MTTRFSYQSSQQNILLLPTQSMQSAVNICCILDLLPRYMFMLFNPEMMTMTLLSCSWLFCPCDLPIKDKDMWRSRLLRKQVIKMKKRYKCWRVTVRNMFCQFVAIIVFHIHIRIYISWRFLQTCKLQFILMTKILIGTYLAIKMQIYKFLCLIVNYLSFFFFLWK